MTIDYSEYLQSETWSRRRKEVFELYGHLCLKCGSSKNLHVHHKTYKRLGVERIDLDLIPLCETCHDKLHAFCKEKHLNLWHGTEDFLRDRVHRLHSLTKKERRMRKKMRRLERKREKKERRLSGYRFKSLPRAIYVPESAIIKQKSIAPQQKKAIMVDVQRFMLMYGLDEKTARELIK